jgi:hypothetical protein
MHLSSGDRLALRANDPTANDRVAGDLNGLQNEIKVGSLGALQTQIPAGLKSGCLS